MTLSIERQFTKQTFDSKVASLDRDQAIDLLIELHDLYLGQRQTLVDMGRAEWLNRAIGTDPVEPISVILEASSVPDLNKLIGFSKFASETKVLGNAISTIVKLLEQVSAGLVLCSVDAEGKIEPVDLSHFFN